MSVIVNLDVVMAQRKMMLKDLSEKTGISNVNLSILKKSKAKAIRFSMLEVICEALDCQPGDILSFEKQVLIF
jgi:putative transcriptional regulator